MTKFWNTYQILMIFLLLSIVLPLNKLNAQESQDNKQVKLYEEQVLMNLDQSYDNPFANNNGNSAQLKNRFRRRAQNSNKDTEEWAFDGTGNYINLKMTGKGNQAYATQKEGTGNFLDLEIHGKENVGQYLQEGNNNILVDKIAGNNIRREVYQDGNDLGLFNQGMQSTPMIINQRGSGMKIKITETPIH